MKFHRHGVAQQLVRYYGLAASNVCSSVHFFHLASVLAELSSDFNGPVSYAHRILCLFLR